MNAAIPILAVLTVSLHPPDINNKMSSEMEPGAFVSASLCVKDGALSVYKVSADPLAALRSLPPLPPADGTPASLQLADVRGPRPHL